LATVAHDFEFENLHLDMVRPRDSGDRTDEQLRAMMARYSDMAPYFRELVSRCSEEIGEDFDINIGNMPYCIAPEISHKIHHDGQFTVTVAASGQGTTQKGFNKYLDKRSDKVKRGSCADCVFDSKCGGVFEKYVEFYGDDEFQPVSTEQLWTLDNAPSHFVLLAEEVIRAWAAEADGEVTRIHERQGFIDVKLVTPQGTDIELRLSAAPTLPAAGVWWQSAGQRLHIQWLSVISRPEELAWVYQQCEGLASRLGGTVEPFEARQMTEAMAQEHQRRTQRIEQQRHAQRKAMLWIDRLRGRNLDVFRYEQLIAAPEGGVTMSWVQGTRRVELDVSASPVGGRPQLSHRAEGMSEADLRAFNVALAAALRGSQRAASL